MPIAFNDFPVESDEVTYAVGRLPTRIYVSRSFKMSFGSDMGQPARYIRKVFDEEVTPDDDNWEWTTDVVYVTPGGRKQLELQVARSAGAVRKIRIQKVPTEPSSKRLEPVLELDRAQSMRLIELVGALDSIPIEGDTAVRVDDQLLRDVFADPDGIGRLYAGDSERFRALIETDADARDVVALQHRRKVTETIRTWLRDDKAFDEAKNAAGGPEKAWQQLLEANPWILGIGLGGQLLTSWDENKLEKSVVGRNIKDVGKRVDALMRTAGIIRSMVFAEIKHHRTELLAGEYRSGCWRPSDELTGAVVQVQQTVHLTVKALREDYIQDQAGDGSLLNSGTFLLKPRSFVIVGSLSELTGSHGGPIPDKVRSFELFRRNLQEPEVITFDELLMRAEWHVQVAEAAAAEDPLIIDEGGVIVDDDWSF